VREVARVVREGLKGQTLIEPTGETTHKFWFERQYPPQGLVYALKWVPPIELLPDHATHSASTSIISVLSPSYEDNKHQTNFVTWLHLSDLHYREEHSYQLRIVEKALLEDVKRTIDEKSLKPDFVAFTGDLAFSGQEKQYIWIEEFLGRLLEAAGIVDKDRLLLVPGNHDVDRNRIDRITARGALIALNTHEEIAEFLGPKGNRASVFAKFRPYVDFYNRFHNNVDMVDDTHYFWTRRFRVGQTVIGVLGINSAWMSGFRRDQDDRVADEGALIVGERQVYEAIQQVEQAGGADLLIALLHHPLDALNESSDKQLVQSLLRRECDFILHGHVHFPEVMKVSALDGETIVIPAGACYDRRDRPNGYNFVRFDLARKQGTVFLRRYANRRGTWIADTETTGDKDGGERAISLLSRKLLGT
jgi:calcineurin-like phosphoesterase family protein